MRGCWIEVDSCSGQMACVSNDMSRTDQSFCCCDGDLCNAQVYDSPVRSTQRTETQTQGECVLEKMQVENCPGAFFSSSGPHSAFFDISSSKYL